MGRNPVVGRQGPVHYMATIPAEADAPRIRVKQIRSGIGHAAGAAGAASGETGGAAAGPGAIAAIAIDPASTSRT